MRTDERLDAVFAALADATRRRILLRLREGEASVSDLAEPFDITLPAVSKHIAVLERAGLVKHRKTGRVRTCRLAAAPLKRAEAWIGQYERFWTTRFDALDAHLATLKKKDE
ncbi:MAG TPA: metalloregulator ArsR/SmtB family transcription factor [Candidatus Elarobacter sp.]|jgi:DNA-binding transcriptional ArsR family regulator|nr:metalloregulator ArsR/SmtB family transcription factor [Candidatus Elarobacter sp.]